MPKLCIVFVFLQHWHKKYKTYPLILVVGKLFCDKRHAKKSATRFNSTNMRVRSVPVREQAKLENNLHESACCSLTVLQLHCTV